MRGLRSEDEDGAFLILWALLLVALVVMVAIVVDLGQVRSVRRRNQSIADFAALAAAPELAARQPQQACGAAFEYLRMNTPDLPSGASMAGLGGCAALPASCGSSTPASEAVATDSGRYTISIRWPVPASDLVSTRFTGPGAEDGADPCARLRVTVSRTNPSFFAGIVGGNPPATASAVVKVGESEDRTVPALWLLDPVGCPALDVSGGARVRVGLESPLIPGMVTVDSDATDCGPKYTLDVAGAGSSLRAVPGAGTRPGQISLFAQLPGATVCTANACQPQDVSDGLVSPQPVNRPQRATRAPVDWRYNCLPSYPTYRGVVPVPACPEAAAASARSPFIDQLRSAVGTAGAPAGFSRWRTAGRSCTVDGTITVAGNWWVDCSTFTVKPGGRVTFTGGNVVFDGGVDNKGSLRLNTANPTATLPVACQTAIAGCVASSSKDAAFVYLREGDLTTTSGAVTELNRSLFYLHDGTLKMNGGASLRWLSPVEGPFDGLSLWAEARGAYTLNGGGSLELEGVFFTPEAEPFKLTGGGGSALQRAQFVSYRLEISGNAELNLAPNERNAIALPPAAGVLIR